MFCKYIGPLYFAIIDINRIGQTARLYSARLYSAVQYSTALYSTIQTARLYSRMQYSRALYNTVYTVGQYSAVQYTVVSWTPGKVRQMSFNLIWPA